MYLNFFGLTSQASYSYLEMHGGCEGRPDVKWLRKAGRKTDANFT